MCVEALTGFANKCKQRVVGLVLQSSVLEEEEDRSEDGAQKIQRKELQHNLKSRPQPVLNTRFRPTTRSRTIKRQTSPEPETRPTSQHSPDHLIHIPARLSTIQSRILSFEE